jgi:hypothetical protein
MVENIDVFNHRVVNRKRHVCLNCRLVGRRRTGLAKPKAISSTLELTGTLILSNWSLHGGAKNFGSNTLITDERFVPVRLSLHEAASEPCSPSSSLSEIITASNTNPTSTRVTIVLVRFCQPYLIQRGKNRIRRAKDLNRNQEVRSLLLKDVVLSICPSARLIVVIVSIWFDSQSIASSLAIFPLLVWFTG